MFELLASAYQACSAALAKLDEAEAAWIAADRAMSAAERAGNALLVAAGAFRLVFVFMNARHYDQAEEAARTAADALWHRADEGDPEAMSLWGALTLQRAVIAARASDSDAAYGFLDRARPVAERLGPGRNDYNTEFGPGERHAVSRSLSPSTSAMLAAPCAPPPRRCLRALARTPGTDAHRRRPRPCPAPPGRRRGVRAPPGRGDHSRAGTRSRPGPPARL